MPRLYLMKDQHLPVTLVSPASECCQPTRQCWHRGQACGSVTDASVVHAPCDHVYHATCLGHWANLSLGQIPKFCRLLCGWAKGKNHFKYILNNALMWSLIKIHQDPSSDLPFSMDCLVRISKISIRVIVFRARNNQNFTSHPASTSMRFKTSLGLNGTIQFMIESFMLCLWILDYGWFALIHPSLPLSTRKRSEARAAVEDSTQSVRSQRDALAREVAPWQPWW